MQDTGFFDEIEHGEVPWGERSIHVPVFYYDSTRLDAVYLAPREKLAALLPSRRMHPIRVTPGQGTIVISAMEFRRTDIGPYNEVAVSIPFTMDRVTPLFTGLLRKPPPEPSIYIHRLPVTTEIACDAGVHFAGYPKFIASIDFTTEGDWTTCRLAEGDQHILTLAGRRLETRDGPRSRVHYFTHRNDRLLRSTGINSEGPQAMSKDSADVRLELGDHPIGRELGELGLGRMAGYRFMPQYQSILSPALESFAV